jgi:cell division septation protein DedD
MRLIPFALVALLALSGCGGDEPEQTPERSTPAPRRPAADTTLGDTIAPDTAAVDTTVAGGEASGSPGAGAEEAAGAGAAGETPSSTGRQRLYTVQIAAFTEPTSATDWAGRLRRQGLPAWTSMAELGGRTFYRVRVGAVRELDQARALGSMVSNRYEWPVWVAPITPADQVPDDAVEATRRVLQGG